MSFNQGVRIDASKVQRRGRGATAGAVGLVGVVTFLALALLSQFVGLDLTPLAADALQTSSVATDGSVQELKCETGADANANAECRMVGAADAIDTYWQSAVKGYRAPDVVLFSGATASSCGMADAATGPFYCPADETIYLDTGFFDTLQTDFGAQTGSLAQMYVLAHEWGHHISNITGSLQQAGRSSGSAGGSVRTELQADCYAGSWVGSASTIPEQSTGQPFLQPVTQAQIDDALDAAAAIGDDHIMEIAGQRVNPDRFTHGSSVQRQRWFMTGYSGGPTTCDTYSVSSSNL